MVDERDRTEAPRQATNDNARPANVDGSVVEPRRATGEILERVVIDIARLIGRQMARADHAARVAANDNGDDRASKDEPEAE